MLLKPFFNFIEKFASPNQKIESDQIDKLLSNFIGEKLMEKYKIAFFTDLHIGVHQNNERWLDVTYKWAKWLSSMEIYIFIFLKVIYEFDDDLTFSVLLSFLDV